MGGEGDCEELSLELSIGGKYAGKSEKLGEKRRDFCGENTSRYDLQKRREIQAWRRLEARRKREERVRKSRGVVGLVDEKLFLEAQRFGERARDRETREKDLFSGEAADELRLSLSSDEKEKEKKKKKKKKRGNGCLYPNLQLAEATSDSENSNGVKSLEKCSSASISQKDIAKWWWQAEAEAERSHKSKARCDGPEGEAEARQMPCVSARGDGRTVMGFLHKYDKREVSIMCVCHGSSFSPAEFVDHAGGFHVSHPLRHITLVTSSSLF